MDSFENPVTLVIRISSNDNNHHEFTIERQSHITFGDLIDVMSRDDNSITSTRFYLKSGLIVIDNKILIENFVFPQFGSVNLTLCAFDKNALFKCSTCLGRDKEPKLVEAAQPHHSKRVGETYSLSNFNALRPLLLSRSPCYHPTLICEPCRKANEREQEIQEPIPGSDLGAEDASTIPIPSSPPPSPTTQAMGDMNLDPLEAMYGPRFEDHSPCADFVFGSQPEVQSQQDRVQMAFELEGARAPCGVCGGDSRLRETHLVPIVESPNVLPETYIEIMGAPAEGPRKLDSPPLRKAYFPSCSKFQDQEVVAAFVCNKCLPPGALTFVRNISPKALSNKPTKTIPTPREALSPLHISLAPTGFSTPIETLLGFVLVKPPTVLLNKAKTAIPSSTGFTTTTLGNPLQALAEVWNVYKEHPNVENVRVRFERQGSQKPLDVIVPCFEALAVFKEHCPPGSSFNSLVQVFCGAQRLLDYDRLWQELENDLSKYKSAQ